jgi:hypothetical protein
MQSRIHSTNNSYKAVETHDNYICKYIFTISFMAWEIGIKEGKWVVLISLPV